MSFRLLFRLNTLFIHRLPIMNPQYTTCRGTYLNDILRIFFLTLRRRTRLVISNPYVLVRALLRLYPCLNNTLILYYTLLRMTRLYLYTRHHPNYSLPHHFNPYFYGFSIQLLYFLYRPTTSNTLQRTMFSHRHASKIYTSRNRRRLNPRLYQMLFTPTLPTQRNIFTMSTLDRTQPSFLYYYFRPAAGRPTGALQAFYNHHDRCKL